MLRRKIIAFGAVVFVAVLTLDVRGQVPQKQSSASSTAQAASIQKEIEGLRSDITSLRSRLTASEGEVNFLKLRLSVVEGAHQSVTLDLTSSGYSRVDTDNGTFLVSASNATPYLDGYKI